MKQRQSSAELPALREFDAVNFLEWKNMDSNIYALLQRKFNKIKNIKLLLTICDFDCLTYLYNLKISSIIQVLLFIHIFFQS